jgi:putative cardiolipin synthase
VICKRVLVRKPGDESAAKVRVRGQALGGHRDVGLRPLRTRPRFGAAGATENRIDPKAAEQLIAIDGVPDLRLSGTGCPAMLLDGVPGSAQIGCTMAARWVQRIILFCIALTLSNCRALTRASDAPSSEHALPAAKRGELAKAELAFAERHRDGQSGFLLINKNDEAFRWRLALIDHARESLDIQYFLWHHDATGILFASRVLAAADRGVRVRILVDDFDLNGKDAFVAAGDQHKNIEVRVFNPWHVRDRSGVVGSLWFVAQRGKLNQRMHNKLMVADNRMAIQGGRNIGDHYFGLGENFNFNDLDVLSTGPIVRDMSIWFDKFWVAERNARGESCRAYEKYRIAAQRKRIRKKLGKQKRLSPFFPLEPCDWSDRLRALPDRLHPGTARILGDEPDKRQGESSSGHKHIYFSAQKELQIVSAYFIPLDDGVRAIRETVDRGVRVRILTNALGSSDMPVANSAYRKHRKKVLATGAELFEARHDAAVKPDAEAAPFFGQFVGLHIKAIVADRRRVYIGTLNLDPRSIAINTEFGLWIDSPGLAAEAGALAETLMTPANAWQVCRDKRGLFWRCGNRRTRMQPARTWRQRMMDWAFMLLPLDRQL